MGIISINLYDFEKVTTYKLQIWIYFTFSKVKAGTRSSSTDCKQSRQTDSSKTKRSTEFDSTVAISQTLFYTQTHRQFFKWLLILELFLYSYVFTNSILLLLFHRLLYTQFFKWLLILKLFLYSYVFTKFSFQFFLRLLIFFMVLELEWFWFNSEGKLW